MKYRSKKSVFTKKVCWFIFILINICILFPVKISKAERLFNEEGTPSYNKSSENYSIWASTIKSYLYENQEDTITRVELVDDKIVYENYNKKFKLLSKGTIKKEMNLFGGFYAGEDANYVVFGQLNRKQSKNCEVIRIVKYSKDWNRIGSCSLMDCNTIVPFDGGSLRFAECGDILYIRTCHKMYQSSDGLNHQANLTLSVNTSSMEITDSYFGVMNIGYGYVSHSFNQFIKVYGKELLAVDHGDAYPRSVALIKYDKPAGENTFTGYCSYTELLEFPGQIGDNSTGGSVGGFEISDSSYLVVGNHNNTNSDVRNIFLSITPQGELVKGNSKLLYLTNYNKDSKIKVSTPQLVKVKEDNFMVLWESTNTDTKQQKVNYILINGNGESLSKERDMMGNLSDCQPIVYEDKVTWYFTQGENPIFCTIPVDGTDAKNNLICGDEFQLNSISYSIIKSTDKIKTVAVKEIGYQSKTTVTIPATIKINGVTYQVTEVNDDAFYNCYEVKNIVFGSNITQIGDLSSSDWNQLQKIIIKSTKLKIINQYAFLGIPDSTVIQVPKTKFNTYKKLLKGKGQSSKVKITYK